ncbi:hypothetical protein M231_04853 [Tremella mesenterica]|uniref:PQ loop repeat protein n=1 Tax=Tremella mesenterica TaxID=5217 RepID=A0A4Q1BJM6_TREME|nr:hypothetical protein M231_04853 [Tremella mesenterica]
MTEVLQSLAGIGMAIGPPLIYADQAYSIVRKRDSSGFSHDVCGVVIIANIIRVFFWLGKQFELPLLVQSLLLILSQLLLLSLCLHYAPASSPGPTYAPLSPLAEHPPSPPPSVPLSPYHQDVSHDAQPSLQNDTPNENHSSIPLSLSGPSPRLQSPGFETSEDIPHGSSSGLRIGKGTRPFGFWQWEGYGTYLEFLAGMIVVLGLAELIFGRWMWCVLPGYLQVLSDYLWRGSESEQGIGGLGFVALTIESTLPIPQFISNYRRKSTYGFRSSTLAGWFFGDAYKTVYFFVRKAPLQFRITAIMTLCWDSAVLFQRIRYRAAPPRTAEENEEGRHLAVER